MDDLKDIHAESSYRSEDSQDVFSGVPNLNTQIRNMENTSGGRNPVGIS